MEDKEINNIELEKLKTRIEGLREVLNDICAESEETNNYEERLKVSIELDEVIVEYLKNLIMK